MTGKTSAIQPALIALAAIAVVTFSCRHAHAKDAANSKCKKGSHETCVEICKSGEDWGCDTLNKQCFAGDGDACLALARTWSEQCEGGDEMKCKKLKRQCTYYIDESACLEACGTMCMRNGLCDEETYAEYCESVYKTVLRYYREGTENCTDESGKKYGEVLYCEEPPSKQCVKSAPGPDDSNVCVDMERLCVSGMTLACLDTSDCLEKMECGTVVDGCRMEGLCKQAIKDIHKSDMKVCLSDKECCAIEELCKKGVQAACEIDVFIISGSCDTKDCYTRCSRSKDPAGCFKTCHGDMPPHKPDPAWKPKLY